MLINTKQYKLINKHFIVAYVNGFGPLPYFYNRTYTEKVPFAADLVGGYVNGVFL